MTNLKLENVALIVTYLLGETGCTTLSFNGVGTLIGQDISVAKDYISRLEKTNVVKVDHKSDKIELEEDWEEVRVYDLYKIIRPDNDDFEGNMLSDCFYMTGLTVEDLVQYVVFDKSLRELFSKIKACS